MHQLSPPQVLTLQSFRYNFKPTENCINLEKNYSNAINCADCKFNTDLLNK